jgi:citrate synthase
LVKLYVLLHADHESGNVSAHATYLVSSCLADIYYSLSAGLNGLAGPLHGGAVYEVIHWLKKAADKFGKVPSADELEKYVRETLAAGQVIPGYGHAVLRKTDPRFAAQLEFGRRHVADDTLFKIADLASKIVPSILQSLGKVANPWPNVDAITGVLQYHYGITQFDYYILLFGISRALGVTANAIWARALELPIERPKSVTTQMLEQMAQKS